MANCDSKSDRIVDVGRPSTSSQYVCAQPFRSKSVVSNSIKPVKQNSGHKKSLKQTAMSLKKQSEVCINSDLLPFSQNLSLGNVCENTIYQEHLVPTPKQKSDKKKDKLQKSLIMPNATDSQTAPLAIYSNFVPNLVPNATDPQTAPLTNYANLVPNNDNVSLQPLPYVSNNSRCLENLSFHPQCVHNLRIRESHRVRQHLICIPHTPMIPAIQPNLFQAQIFNSDANTPRYLQNLMQHPLLCKSLSVDNHLQAGIITNPVNLVGATAQKKDKTNKKSLKKKSKKKDDNSEGKTFDSYMTEEDVENDLKNNELIEGVLRINPKQFQHSYVSSTDRNEQDILIEGIKNRNRALEGDVVIVQLISDNEGDEGVVETKQKRGKVVQIKEKVHNRTCIGVLKLMPDKNRQKALFIPRDHRIPRLNIPFTCWPDNFYQDAKKYENTLFLAKITDWYDTRFAVGKILYNIGQSGDMITETRAILAQTDLDITPYGPEFRDLYPRLDYSIPDDEIEKRDDCRKLCIFSIDPSNCRDIDDAVSCHELDNGNFEIGVHISDVAHYLKEDTLLDEKVADKATTIYTVERAYHMLPDELCMLCSLFPGVDKLAFSIFWEITPNAEILGHRISKTVIQSCCQLTYDHAQAILEDRKDAEKDFPETYNGFYYNDIYKSIKNLGKIAAIFRRNRFENGALRIDQPKVSFHLNTANGLPENFWIYESKESHQLIEEFMLLANMTVAKRVYDDHPQLAFLRSHPPPSTYMLKQLAKALQPMGIQLNISSAGELHRSLLPYVGPDSQDRGKAMVLSMLCAKPMTRAKYFCAAGCDDDEFHHYALNVPLYTHFTSPIRRYADIMVHRLLAASLKYRDAPEWDVNKVRMVAAQCNKQKYNAKKASELSTELYILKYIEMHSPLITEAVVVEVREKYIDVIIVAMGLNRRIFLNNDFPGECMCIKDVRGDKLSVMEVTWHATQHFPEVKQVIEVFSILQVEMYKGDDAVKIETKLMRPE